jgi:hypothetical protein
MNEIEMKNIWEQNAQEFLINKTIKEVRYMTESEASKMFGYFESTPLIIIFTDNTYIIPSADDEGNAGGVLFTSSKDTPVLPRC